MSLISSLVSGIAGGVFRAVRDSYKESSEKEAAAQAAADAAPNAVKDNQARSLADRQRLMAQGKPASFAQHYQAQIAQSVDTDHDGKISKDELEKQVTAGGGTSAQAATLYKAMDKNKDGSVSVDELQDSVPVPQAALAQQIIQMLQAAREAQAAKAGSGASANAQAVGGVSSASATATASAGAAPKLPQIAPPDPARVLARLAAQLPGAAA